MPPQNSPDKIDKNQTATVFVCVTCGQNDAGPDRNGLELLAALESAGLPENVRVQKIKCFGACNHSCAVGVTAPGKIGYLYGNLTVKDGVAALRDYVPKYIASHNGVVTRDQRPDILKDILIRLPHADWASADGTVRVEDDANLQQGQFRQAFDDV